MATVCVKHFEYSYNKTMYVATYMGVGEIYHITT